MSLAQKLKDAEEAVNLIDMKYQVMKSSGSTIHQFRNLVCTVNAELQLARNNLTEKRIHRIKELIDKLDQWVSNQPNR